MPLENLRGRSRRGIALVLDSYYALTFAVLLLSLAAYTHSVSQNSGADFASVAAQAYSGDLLRASCTATVAETAGQSATLSQMIGGGELSGPDLDMTLCQLFVRLSNENTSDSRSKAGALASELLSPLVSGGFNVCLSVDSGQLYCPNQQSVVAAQYSQAAVYSFGAAGPFETPLGPSIVQVGVER